MTTNVPAANGYPAHTLTKTGQHSTRTDVRLANGWLAGYVVRNECAFSSSPRARAYVLRWEARTRSARWLGSFDTRREAAEAVLREVARDRAEFKARKAARAAEAPRASR